MLFSRLYFGFESAGLGYPALQVDDEELNRLARTAAVSREDLESVCHATIRVLGDLFRYRQEPQEYAPRRLARIGGARRGRACATSSTDALRRSVSTPFCCVDAVLSAILPDWWSLALRAQSPAARCPNSDRPRRVLGVPVLRPCPSEQIARMYGLPACTTHRATGASASSFGGETTTRWRPFRFRTPTRLHCEELTAQTDDQAAAAALLPQRCYRPNRR